MNPGLLAAKWAQGPLLLSPARADLEVAALGVNNISSQAGFHLGPRFYPQWAAQLTEPIQQGRNRWAT
jgi:hypothetical protein